MGTMKSASAVVTSASRVIGRAIAEELGLRPLATIRSYASAGVRWRRLG